MTEALAARGLYAVAVVLVATGLLALADDPNLVKKVLGLNVFQAGVFLFFVAAAARWDGRPPLVDGPGPYVNPLPHVLVLTAIVVGVSVTAVGLALVVRIHAGYGTVRTDRLREGDP